MYISKIEIDHFGKWEHETFTFHPNLQVVQGLNESGKTTLRRFIEQMLFDFKQKKKGETLHFSLYIFLGVLFSLSFKYF